MHSIRWICLSATFLLTLLLVGLGAHPTQAQELPPGTVPPPLFLPLISVEERLPPPGRYEAIPVESRADNRPAATHGDLNLALRGYTPTTASLMLVDLGGDTDPQAPQLAGIVSPTRLPSITAAYQVFDWDWRCGTDGCRGAPLTAWEATLVEAAIHPYAPLYLPPRGPEIYGGGYRALVLYAEPTRLTLAYTRRDGADHGYVLHLEGIHVDAGLVTLYQQVDATGRQQLPALRNGERLGYADRSGRIKLAIRDTGQFMDPRSRKDWWVGFLLVNGECSMVNC
jgi:hypothetical protein